MPNSRNSDGNDGAPPARPGPWDHNYLAPGTVEIRMRAPRSPIPEGGRQALIIAGAAAALFSLRFLLLGAWPVLVFSVLDIGALAIALHIFNKSKVPEERLRIHDGEVELIRSDERGRHTRVALPVFWTRLEMQEPSDIRCSLWLVSRQRRYPIALCISDHERRKVAPRIRAALAEAHR